MIQDKNIQTSRKNLLFLTLVLATFSLTILLQFSMVSADMQEINYDVTTGEIKNAQFKVQTLKYEPYPVSAGEWFDLWIKVQNTGQNDAPDARFELVPEYPFTGEDLVREYGFVPGVSTAWKHKQLGDKDIQANQVIMKFRIKVADNAPVGESLIHLKTSAKGDGFGLGYNLPIEIGKTKTVFDIVMQDSTSQGTAFAIANVGDKDSVAVTFTIPSQENVEIRGPSSSIIGNLEEGDFTTLVFEILPNENLNELRIQLEYTDSAGIRNTIEKIVPIDVYEKFGQEINESGGFSLTTIFWIILGGVLGIFGDFLRRKRKKKKE